MINKFLLFLLLITTAGASSQSVIASPERNSQYLYTFKGFYQFEKGLFLPRDNSAMPITNPAVTDRAGLFRYNPTLGFPQYFNGTVWVNLQGGDGGVPSWQQTLGVSNQSNLGFRVFNANESQFYNANGLTYERNGLKTSFGYRIPIANTKWDIPAKPAGNYIIADTTTVSEMISAAIGNIPPPELGGYVKYQGNLEDLNLEGFGLYANDIFTNNFDTKDFNYRGVDNSIKVFIDADNIANGAELKHQLPNANGTYALGAKVGNTYYPADETGAINIPQTNSVPYTGATDNVDLGDNSITAAAFNITNAGTISEDAEEIIINSPNGVGLFSGNNAIGISNSSGLFIRSGENDADSAFIRTENITGTTIHQLPNRSGTYALSVNNTFADANGNITIPTGGGGTTYTFTGVTNRTTAATSGNNVVYDISPAYDAARDAFAQTVADAKVQNSLNPSTTVAPSATAVNTALATKQNTIAGIGFVRSTGTAGEYTVITGNATDIMAANGLVQSRNTYINNATIPTFTLNNTPVTPGTSILDAWGRLQAQINEKKLTSGFLNINANYTVVMTAFGQNGQLDLFVNATAGNVSITLPTATAMAGYTLNVIKTDASANSVNITGGTINQANSYPLTVQNQSAIIKSDNTQFRVF